MTSAPLPAGLDLDDEIAVTWNQDPENGETKVTARLGGAQFIVITDDTSVELVPWLIASAPQILEAAWARIESDQEAEEADITQEEA